jgi:predicted nucleic acid-binding protein
VLGMTEIFPINTTISDLAMLAVHDYALSHGMQMGDALIAAIALEHGATALTFSAKHSSTVEALKVRGIF